MGSFWFNLRYVLRHPEFVWQYHTRIQSIASLMDVSKATAREYLREYGKVNADIEEKLRSLPYVGQMDRRKNEVLYALIRIARPKVVVETGVAAGISSAIILRGMELNGHGTLFSIDAGLTSVDGISLPKDKPTGFMVPENLRENWRLIMGFSKDTLESLLERLGEIDFFFHDSEHTYQNMMFEFNAAWRYLKPGGLIVSDNIEWNSAFNEFVLAKEAPHRKLYSLGVARKP